MEGVRLLVPVGGSRGNILQACKLEGVAEIHLLLTRSLFPDEESVRRLIDSIEGLVDHPPFVRLSWINGPDAGPVGCRDSIQEWKEDNGDYVPDQIFVTGSTLLIVATLARIFPSAGLVALRGLSVVRLPEGELISTADPLGIDTYLALHGMKLERGEELELDGHKLKASLLDNCAMTGPKATLTWRWTSDRGKVAQKKEAQLVGSSIKEIVESVGIGAFNFNAFGYGNYMSNSSDPKIVNTEEEEEE